MFARVHQRWAWELGARKLSDCDSRHITPTDWNGVLLRARFLVEVLPLWRTYLRAGEPLHCLTVHCFQCPTWSTHCRYYTILWLSEMRNQRSLACQFRLDIHGYVQLRRCLPELARRIARMQYQGLEAACGTGSFESEAEGTDGFDFNRPQAGTQAM